jgi:hypothetical protein
LSGTLSALVGLKHSRRVGGIGRRGMVKEMGMEHVGKLECVCTFCYLEDKIGSCGVAEETSRAT